MIGLTRRHGIKNGKEQIKINNMNMIDMSLMIIKKLINTYSILRTNG